MGILPDIALAQPAVANSAPTGHSVIEVGSGTSGQGSIGGNPPESKFEEVLEEVVTSVLGENTSVRESRSNGVVPSNAIGAEREDDLSVLSLRQQITANSKGEVLLEVGRIPLTAEGPASGPASRVEGPASRVEGLLPKGIAVAEGIDGPRDAVVPGSVPGIKNIVVGSLGSDVEVGAGEVKRGGASAAAPSLPARDQSDGHLVQAQTAATPAHVRASSPVTPPANVPKQSATVATRAGAIPIGPIQAGSFGGDAQTPDEGVNRVNTPGVTSPLASDIEVKDSLIRAQSNVAIPVDTKGSTPLTPKATAQAQNAIRDTRESRVVSQTPQPLAMDAGSLTEKAGGADAEELLMRLQTSAVTSQNGPASTVVRPVSAQFASEPDHGVRRHVGVRPQGLAPVTDDIGDVRSQAAGADSGARSAHHTNVAASSAGVLLGGAGQKMTTDPHVGAAGPVVDGPKGERALSTSLAESRDESDGQPNPQAKPINVPKSQAGIVNIDVPEFKTHLSSEFVGMARDVKVSDPDMLQPPARIEGPASRVDVQKTLGMTPVENVQDPRGASQVTRGSLMPLTDMSDGIQRVEHAMKMSSLTNQQGVRLHLDPPDLGRLVVNLSVHDQRVTAGMMTDQPIVRDILLANQHRLDSALQDQGLRMQDFTVDVGRRSSYLGDERSQHETNTARRAATDDSAEEAPPEHHQEHTTEHGGLSLFA